MAQESEPFTLIFDGKQRSDILTYTITQGIKKSTNYNFKVAAINQVGVSPFSPTLTSFAAVVPATPQGFNITSSDLGSVYLAWSPPLYDGGSPLSGYYVYYQKTGIETTWTKTSLLSFALFEYQVTSLTTNSQYSFKITAANIKGESI
jgi:titin